MSRFGPSGSRGGSGGGGNALLLVGLVMLSGGLLVSYKLGNMGESGHQGEILEMKDKQKSLRQNLLECHDLKEKEMSKKRHGVVVSDRLKVLKDLNAKMEKQNDDLSRSNDNLERKNSECVDESEAIHETWSEKDRDNAHIVKQLADQHQNLVDTSSRYTNVRSMSHMLLDTTIRKLFKEQQQLRFLLHKPNITGGLSEHLSSVVSKWENRPEFLNQSLIPEKAEFGTVVKKPKTNFTTYYDRARERESKIFFQAKDANGVYRKPTWNGRTGTSKIVSGVHDTNYVDPLPLTKVLRKLYDYALCAMGNADILSYPAFFKSGERVENLVEILETPMVNFCKDCKHQENTAAFKLACHGHTTQEQYGSIFFWRMRSRIRFSDVVMGAADEFIAGNGLESALGVRLRRGGFDKECETQWRGGMPQLAYSRVLKGTVAEMSTDFEESCYPSEGHVVHALNTFLKENHRFDKVYFSTDASEEEWSALTQQIRVPIVRYPQMDTATGQAVDITIASKCHSILVNRWDTTSSQIAELYLLEKKLAHEGVAVW